MAKKGPVGISIIICCYNSALRLPETLKHIAGQEVDGNVNWEVLVINNNSQDSTREVASSEWSKYDLPNVNFRIIDEPRPGLSFARARGIMESLYYYLLFCDDDNWLNPHYLKIGLDLFISDPRIGVIGGKGIEAPECEPPEWFAKNRLSYAVGPHSKVSGDITESRGDVYGAGAFFRKEALTRLYNNGFRSLLSDRTGSQLSSGGDSELCICVRLLGYRIWYDERLIFHHFIPKERLTETYFLKLHKGISIGLTQLLPYYFIIDNAIGYDTRIWIRKQWIWFIGSRIVHFVRHGLFWNLLYLKIQNRISEKNLRALYYYESMKTLWKEKAKTTENHALIRSAKWYKELQITR